MATHSSILSWRISWTEEPGGLQSMGSQSIGHYWVTNTHTHTETKWIFIFKIKLKKIISVSCIIFKWCLFTQFLINWPTADSNYCKWRTTTLDGISFYPQELCEVCFTVSFKVVVSCLFWCCGSGGESHFISFLFSFMKTKGFSNSVQF